MLPVPSLSRLSAALLLPFLAPALAAQWQHDPGSKVDERRASIAAAWDRMAARGEGPDAWHASWSAASRTPEAIWGPGLRIAGPIHDRQTAELVSATLLVDRADLLGTGGSKYELEIHETVAKTHVLVYGQRFGGLRVLDGRADVRLKDHGVVALFGARCFPIPDDQPLRPTVPVAIARANAARELPAAAEALEKAPVELLLWADRQVTDCRPRLAWQFDLRSSPAAGRGYVDALTGEWIQFRDDRWSLRHCDHTARSDALAARRAMARVLLGRSSALPVAVVGNVLAFVADGYGPNGPLVNRPLAGARVQVQGGGSAFTDANGDFSVPHNGTTPVQVVIDFSAGEYLGSVQTSQGTAMRTSATLTPGTPATVQIYSATATEFEVAQSTAFHLTDKVARFVRQPHILAGSSQLATLDSLRVTVNDTQFTCNAVYSGNTTVFAASSSSGGQSCPNFAFSTVVEHEWGHGLDDVFGGIGDGGLAEGWADILANFCTGQPIIGENFLGPGQHVRDASNSTRYPNPGGPHDAGLPWMGGSWKLRERLRQSLGNGPGTMHAETIVVGSIAANASTIPAAVREVFVLDDNDGNLNNGTPNCLDLFAAYTTTHGIPSPVQTCSTNPGVITEFGAGCQGTGSTPPYCEQQNEANTGSGLVPSAPPGFLLAYAVRPATAMQITAVELFTQAVPGGNGQVAIHREAGGQPAATAIATVNLRPGATPSFYSGRLANPISVQAGETIYLVHDAGDLEVSIVNSGNLSAVPTLVDPGFGSWLALPAGIPDFAAWRVECVGGGSNNAVPRLSIDGLPAIGTTRSLGLDQAAVSSRAVVFVGASSSNWGSVVLPWSLAPVGAPACNLLVAPTILLPGRSDVNGGARFALPIPNDMGLVGVTAYAQALVLDPGANAAGAALTGGLALRIGTP